MTSTSREPGDQGLDPAFPDVIDDASPERASVPEPQVFPLPGDGYLGVDAVGTTNDEQAAGESLTNKLDREIPEPDPYAAVSRSDSELDSENDALSDPEGRLPGRLVEPDEGAHTDVDADVIASEVFGGEDDLSPEERAMHIERG